METESSLLIEAFKIAPGLAVAGYLAWIASKRARESELHVEEITSKFVGYIVERDKKAAEDAEANRRERYESQKLHAEHFKEEQDRFISERTEDRRQTKDMFDKLLTNTRQ